MSKNGGIRLFRAGTIKNIRSSLLLNEKFEADDFTFQQMDEDEDFLGTSTLLTVTYAYNDACLLQLRAYDDPESYTLTRAPGRRKDLDTISVTDMKAVLQLVLEWTDLLLDDLLAGPVLRDIAQQAEDIERLNERLDGLPDEYFTRTEAHELMERLATIETEMLARLQSESERNSNLVFELEDVKKEIAKLKSQITILTKRNWLKSFLTKVGNWARRNPAVLGQVANASLQMLPDDIRNHFPIQEVGNALLGATKQSKRTAESE